MNLEEYFKKIPDENAKFILEEEIFGDEYRAFVCGGKVVAVLQRLGVFVKGDGKRKLNQLIDGYEANLKYNPYMRRLLPKKDNLFDRVLKEQDVNLDSLIASDRLVRLSYAANFSAGGLSKDKTDTVSEGFVDTCLNAVGAVSGLTVCGLDIIVNPEGVPYVIEMNGNPALACHVYPTDGKSRSVVADVVDLLMPSTQRRQHRIYFKKQKMRRIERIKHALKGNFYPNVTLKLPFDDLDTVDTWRIVFSGKVQSVGFRAHVCKVAKPLNVHGHVRNLKDGTVEAIACSTTENLNRFLNACKENHPKASVSAAEAEPSRHVVFHGFRVAETET